MKAYEIYRQIRSKADEVKEAIHAVLTVRGSKDRWTADDLIDYFRIYSCLKVIYFEVSYFGSPEEAEARARLVSESGATKMQLHLACHNDVSAVPPVDSNQRTEFNLGYKAGYSKAAYSPTSLSYIEGYESGERARDSRATTPTIENTNP